MEDHDGDDENEFCNEGEMSTLEQLVDAIDRSLDPLSRIVEVNMRVKGLREVLLEKEKLELLVDTDLCWNVIRLLEVEVAGLVDPCMEMRGLVESVKQKVVAARCLVKELEGQKPESRSSESTTSSMSSVFLERTKNEERFRREQFERTRRASTGSVRLADARIGVMDREQEKEKEKCPQEKIAAPLAHNLAKHVSPRKFSLPILREKASSAVIARKSGCQPELWPLEEQK
jgi:hypothetical protein